MFWTISTWPTTKYGGLYLEHYTIMENPLYFRDRQWAQNMTENLGRTRFLN